MNDLDSCKGCRYYGLRTFGSSQWCYEHHCYRNSGGYTLRSEQRCSTSNEPPSAPPACKDKEAKL